MSEKPKTENVERNHRVQKCGEDGLVFLRETIGLSEDQITSLILQIRKECPSLNTKKKAVARLMNSLNLFREECEGLCRAADRYNALLEPEGTVPPSVAEIKRPKRMRESGLGKYLERRDKMYPLEGANKGQWLPHASEIAGENGDEEIKKLLRGIASEDDPCYSVRLAQLLRWGALLSSAANGRKNKRR